MQKKFYVYDISEAACTPIFRCLVVIMVSYSLLCMLTIRGDIFD